MISKLCSVVVSLSYLVNEFCGLWTVHKRQKCGLYMPFSSWVVLQATCLVRLVAESCECFNYKWPLYSDTADRPHKNCLCQGETEECQVEQSDMARRIAYHWRIPGRRWPYCWWSFCSMHSVSPLSNSYGFWHHAEYCFSRLLVLPGTSMYSTFSWIWIASLLTNNCPHNW